MSVAFFVIFIALVAAAAFVAGLLVGRKHQNRLNAIENAARSQRRL